MVTKREFIQRIKTKYPGYKDVDDDTLYQRITTKYPEYRKQITEDVKPATKYKGGLTEEEAKKWARERPTPMLGGASLAGAERFARGLTKGATLGYADLPGEESFAGELAGSFLPYAAAAPIGGLVKGAGILSKAPALARIAGAAAPMATVGALRPAESLKERGKQALFEGAIGGGAQTLAEAGRLLAGPAGRATTWFLSKTTGIPEEQMAPAISDTMATFKWRGKTAWEKLAKRFKLGHDVLRTKSGKEVQTAIANAPKLSKVGFNYTETIDDVLKKEASIRKKWLGAERLQANEKETLRKLHEMLQSPEGRFGNKMSFQKLHQAKELLYDNINYAKSTRPAGFRAPDTEGERLLKSIANSINKKLGKASPEYAKANKYYSLYKKKLEPIKTMLEDKSMTLPNKLKSLDAKSGELQQAVKNMDRMLPKEYRIGRELKLAQAAKEFEPITRKGAGLFPLAGGIGVGYAGMRSPAVAAGLGAAALTTSPRAVGAGLRGGAMLSRSFGKLPSTTRATIPILQKMLFEKE